LTESLSDIRQSRTVGRTSQSMTTWHPCWHWTRLADAPALMATRDWAMCFVACM